MTLITNVKEWLTVRHQNKNLADNISPENIARIGIRADDIDIAMTYKDQYAAYRSQFPIRKYFNYLDSPLVTISGDFTKMMNLVFAISFGRGVQAGESEDDPALSGTAIYLALMLYMSDLVDFLRVTPQTDESEQKEMAAKVFDSYLKLIDDEADQQYIFINRFLQRSLLLREEYISTEMSDVLYLMVGQEFMRKLIMPIGDELFSTANEKLG